MTLDDRAYARVVSFNIKVATETTLAHLASDLCHIGADLSALQEVGSHWSMGPKLNQLAHLALAQGHDNTSWLPLLERPWSEDPYRGGPFVFNQLSAQQDLQSQSGHFGIGLSARGRFENEKSHYLIRMSDEQRGIRRVDWWHPSYPNSPLTVLCTHLSVKPAERLLQIDQLVDLSESISGPSLLLGDLNDQPDSEALNRLYHQGWEDLYMQGAAKASAKPRFTFSVREPHRCIDYILGRGVTCINANIDHNMSSSDHFPIWADLTW